MQIGGKWVSPSSVKICRLCGVIFKESEEKIEKKENNKINIIKPNKLRYYKKITLFYLRITVLIKI